MAKRVNAVDYNYINCDRDGIKGARWQIRQSLNASLNIIPQHQLQKCNRSHQRKLNYHWINSEGTDWWCLSATLLVIKTFEKLETKIKTLVTRSRDQDQDFGHQVSIIRLLKYSLRLVARGTLATRLQP